MKSKPLDHLNLGIARELRSEPRMTNKALAQKFDVSEMTIAARIRAMIEQRIIRPTVQRDMRWFGYEFLCMIDVHVSGRAPAEIAAEAAALPNVMSIALTIGNPAIHMHAFVKDRKSLMDDVLRPLARIRGVARVASDLVLEFIKFQPDYGILNDNESFQFKVQDNDDERLVNILQMDARVSYREVARRLDVSESYVRTRLKRLQEENLLRIGLVTNPYALGLDHISFIRLCVAPIRFDHVARALCADEQATLVFATSGKFNLYCVYLSRKQTDLHRLLTPGNLLDGIEEAEVHIEVSVFRHRYDLVRIGV